MDINNMIIIAFSQKTSKILPRIFCRNMRHCAPIIPTRRGRMTIYQFTAPGRIRPLKIKTRDLKILRAHGWCFIYIPRDVDANFNPKRAMTCVDLSKRAAGIHKWNIQTPDGLYKYLNQ